MEIFACGAAALISLSGCPAPTDGASSASDPIPGGGTGSGELIEDSELFDEPSDGSYTFKTNDTAYQGSFGYTFWARTGKSQNPFASRETTLSKISGDGTAGYGIIFCYGTTPTGEETMLAVMINNSREYIIGEIIGAEFTEIVPWTECAYLKKGLNQANTVKVTLSSGIFTLYLNGEETATFNDDEAPLHTGGDDGFIVVISPIDDFPSTPVQVTFTE
jgi:hypothetical protein